MLEIFRHWARSSSGWLTVSGLGLSLVVGSTGVVSAQDSSSESAGVEMFHSFTDKQGRQLKARVVSVAKDRKSMVILDESGKTFALEITKLSLNAQQYLKQWIATQPSLAAFRLQVDVEKIRAKPQERFKDGEYLMVSEYSAYRIKLTNQSRETLENAEIEYSILRKERVRIYHDEESNEMKFSSASSPYAKTEIRKLEPLGFNREVEVVTNGIKIDLVYHDDAKPDAEDILVGMVARVRDGTGNLLGEFRSGDSGIKEVKWESLKQYAAGGGATPDRPSTASDQTPRQVKEWAETYEGGDFVRLATIPSLIGKPVQISALIELGGLDETGTIVALGEGERGFSVFVADGYLQFWFRRKSFTDQLLNSRIRLPVTAIPAGEFRLGVSYDAEKMAIEINGEKRVDGPSVGLLEKMPVEGFSVGYESGKASVGPKAPPHDFTGRISELQVTVGD